MLSPISLIKKECFVCVRSPKDAFAPAFKHEDFEMVCYKTRIVSAFRVGNTYVIETEYGFFDLQSVLIHDEEQPCKVVCDIYNKPKGGVTHEQKETSDQG